ncbi:MAG: phosphoadenosine phosphosulfate reductase family protein [Lachnospiraceae bacterium]|nr:phosphoadenosine phosphosulfate reductase family protein [Lachnospiraceae bacterium]
MKHIASCSFGKDSLAMVLKILEEGLPLDEVIFFDTGMEFDSIYHNRDKLKEMLIRRNIIYADLSSENDFLYDMFDKPVKYRKPKDDFHKFHYGYGWCGGTVRWGTLNKILAFKNHYKEFYPCETIIEYIGIAFDEFDRVKISEQGNILKEYPLVKWGMTEKDCLTYCYEHGWDWNENGVDLYSILDRVSCWCCRNKNLKELKNIYIYLPQYWRRLRKLQEKIETPMKGEGKSVFQLEERFEMEIKIEEFRRLRQSILLDGLVD